MFRPQKTNSHRIEDQEKTCPRGSKNHTDYFTSSSFAWFFDQSGIFFREITFSVGYSYSSRFMEFRPVLAITSRYIVNATLFFLTSSPNSFEHSARNSAWRCLLTSDSPSAVRIKALSMSNSAFICGDFKHLRQHFFLCGGEQHLPPCHHSMGGFQSFLQRVGFHLLNATPGE